MRRSLARAKTLGRRTRVVLAVGALALGSTVATTLPSFAEDLGGLDLQQACDQQWGAGRTTIRLGPFDYSVMGWHCVDGSATWYGLDMQWACEQQKGPGTHADYHDHTNAYSWYCWR